MAVFSDWSDKAGGSASRGRPTTHFRLGVFYKLQQHYDEAHDVLAGPLGETPAPHRVDPPVVNLDAGGDYGYDEAHDFGAP